MPTATPYDEALWPLFKLSYSWADPWLVFSGSDIGRSHLRDGVRLQDSYLIGARGPHLWLVIADGISKSALSHEASLLACQSCNQTLSAMLTADAPPDEADLRDVIQTARQALVDRAETTHAPLTDYGTTLALAVLTGNHVAAASIGDSTILAYQALDNTAKGKKAPVTHRVRKMVPIVTSAQPDPRRSSTGGTYHLASADHDKVLTVRAETYPHLKAVAAFTDGVNDLFPPAEDGTYSPALLDNLTLVLPKTGPGKLWVPLTEYFADPQHQRTHDDRTLIIAYRPDDTQRPPRKTA